MIAAGSWASTAALKLLVLFGLLRVRVCALRGRIGREAERYQIRSQMCDQGSPDWTMVKQVCQTVDQLGRWLPRPPLCLERSLAAMWVLRRRAVPAVLVIGVRSFPISAHAWIEVCGRVVNDDSLEYAAYRRLPSCAGFQEGAQQ